MRFLRLAIQNSPDLVLDNTLRFVDNTFRKIGGELMAIEFKYKGTAWRVDTAKEAVALRNELETADRAHFPMFDSMERLSGLWTPDKFMDVLNGVGDLQRKLLSAVRRKPGMTSKELIREVGVDSEVALAGVISGLSKQLQQMGVQIRDVLLIDVKWGGKTKTRRFTLEEFFLGAGAEQGWPDEWSGRTTAASSQRKRKQGNAGSCPKSALIVPPPKGMKGGSDDNAPR